jgi:PAS domain S-box-containing protein
MKIRSFIFLVVTALGLFPVLILAALSLPKTIERLEYASELETQARSHVGLTQLNARIRCLKKSLIRSATLPSALATLEDSSKVKTLSNVMKHWFGNDDQVKGFMLIDAEGIELLSIHRHGNRFIKPDFSEVHKGHQFLEDSLAVKEDHVLVKLVDHKTDPFHRTLSDEYELIMSTPVVTEGGITKGVILLRIDMSLFLQGFMDSYWVTDDGSYLRGCRTKMKPIEFEFGGVDTECNAFQEFPGLKIMETTDPLILAAKNKDKIAWMPLVFNREQQAVMWVGTLVDESAMKKWKVNMIISVLVIFSIMSILVFISAKWIAARFEFIQKDLLTGLHHIINNERQVTFDWNAPLELKKLAVDLTGLSKRYSELCDARNDAEISLRESEDKFRSLTGSALDGIILMDHGGNIAYWNEAAATIFGFSDKEAMGHPIHALIDPRREGEDLTVKPLEQVESGSSFWRTVELIARNKNGTDVYVELSLSSTTIKGQWHAIWIVRDISGRKRVEEKARTQRQQLQQADKMISLGLLVSGVAHEINNPNSIALLNVPILARSWESVKPILDDFYEENGDFSIAGIEYSTMRNQIPRICMELDESAVRIKQIVVELKDYARQETSGQMEEVKINDVVKSAVRLTSNTIQKRTRRFVTHYAKEELMVQGNKQRLSQVVINLIQNSLEALEDSEKSLSISTRYNETVDGVEIAISDEGTGIAPEDLQQVTDPFFTTKRTMGGTGLGLSVSAGIVKEHNGLMNFSSEIGVGTQVVIVFPAIHNKE